MILLILKIYKITMTILLLGKLKITNIINYKYYIIVFQMSSTIILEVTINN